MKPNITEIKELICGLKRYRTYFGVVTPTMCDPGSRDFRLARPQDLIVEFDTERKGVRVEYVTEAPDYGERRRIRFRLQENWHESVYEQKLAVYTKHLVLGAWPTSRRYGVDRVMKLLYALQTKEMSKLGEYQAFAAWLGSDVSVGYPLRDVAAKLREPYVNALGIELGDA